KDASPYATHTPALHDALPILARLIGRSPRELPGILSALHYRRVPESEGKPAYWRRLPRKGPRRSRRAPDNAFSALAELLPQTAQDRKSTRLNSSHVKNSYAVF